MPIAVWPLAPGLGGVSPPSVLNLKSVRAPMVIGEIRRFLANGT